MTLDSREGAGVGSSEMSAIGKWGFSNLKENFLSRIEPEPNSGCWLWMGYRSPKGYGRFSPHDQFSIRAHVMAWLFYRGPSVGWVLHRCDNPPCVNPDHLFLGDHGTNMRDCAAKGRHYNQRPGAQAGERNTSARLTTSIVVDIRRRFFIYGQSRRTIREALCLPRSTVDHIIANRRWPEKLALAAKG